MALHLDALTLVTRLHLLEIGRVAVQLGQQQCPPPLRAAGQGGAPRVYAEESLVLMLLALLRTLWRLSYQEVHDWLCVWPGRRWLWPAACGLPQGD